METLFDVWEGSLDIDEEIIKAGGIVGLIIRLNHMSGGHHKDTNFDAQWVQSERFLRAPYFVYNPWVSASVNFQWLINNAPKETTRVFVDIEVKYNELTPAQYADQVQAFINQLLLVCPRVTIYTGQWFLGFLEHWPTNVDYWWARYPNRFYPDNKESWAYTQLETSTEQYGFWPDPQKKCPSKVSLWQCSGDRLILPGCVNRPVDVNLWNGSYKELCDWWGVALAPPTEPNLEEKVNSLYVYAKNTAKWPLP